MASSTDHPLGYQPTPRKSASSYRGLSYGEPYNALPTARYSTVHSPSRADPVPPLDRIGSSLYSASQKSSEVIEGMQPTLARPRYLSGERLNKIHVSRTTVQARNYPPQTRVTTGTQTERSEEEIHHSDSVDTMPTDTTNHTGEEPRSDDKIQPNVTTVRAIESIVDTESQSYRTSVASKKRRGKLIVHKIAVVLLIVCTAGIVAGGIWGFVQGCKNSQSRADEAKVGN